MSSTHWNILSSWSKAGVGTSIVLELKKPPSQSSGSLSTKQQKSSPRIAFDMGATSCFDDAIPAKYVMLSHGHVDHVGALFSHARAHAVTCGGAAPTYLVPAQLLEQVERCRDAMSLLDATNMHPEGEGGRSKSLINMKLVPVSPGDEIPLKGIHYGSKTSFFVRAIQVDHAGHPALGYVIGSRTTAGLKAEYQNLDGKSIRDLVKSGVSIKDDPVEKIEVAYTGDTCANGLMRKLSVVDAGCEEANGEETAAPTVKQQSSLFGVEQMFQAELLLSELTFLDSSEGDEQRRKASERGHLHINDLETIFSSHGMLMKESSDNPTTSSSSSSIADAASTTVTVQHPRSIVFYHLSAKYQPARRALDLIAEGLPNQIRDRCHVAISSMLTQEEKTCDDSASLVKLIQHNGCISLAEYISSQKDNASS